MIKNILLLFCILFVVLCTEKPTEGTVDETDTQIALVGYVIDGGTNKGIKDLVIRLAKTGFNDTTDENGYYSINVSEYTLNSKSINLDTLTDSVEVVKDQQVVRTIDVVKWIDSLPTVYFTQRNISGTLEPSIDNPRRVEAVVTGYQYSPDTSFTEYFNMYYFTGASDFSGFVYFKDNVLDSYSVYINVYNSDSIFSGRSITKGFPNSAGNIDFPEFDPFNAVPEVSLSKIDTAYVNDTINYEITKSDNFDGYISKVEIKKFNDSIWSIIDTSDTIISIILPDSSNIINTYVKVTDNDGNFSFDTVSTIVLDTIQRFIKLEGFVMLQSSKEGISDVEVQIPTTPFYGITDEDGYFIINVTEDTLIQNGIILSSLDKKVDMFINDRKITESVFDKWEDTISTIFLMGKNIHGSFNPKISNPKSIEAIVQSLSDSTQINSFQLFYLEDDSIYSGTINSEIGIVDSYSVYVKVFNSDSLFTGKSVQIKYTYLSGDIEIPEFDPFNAIPSVSIESPDSVGINDTIVCYISAFDSFGGIITSIEVDKGHTGIFYDLGTDTSFSFITPDSACIYNVVVKVTDNDGNTVVDTVVITVLEPVLTISSTLSYISHDTILLSTSAISDQSDIIKWEWDIGNTGIFTETTPDTFIKVINPDSAFLAIVKVKEEYGFYILDTLNVDVFKFYNGMVLIPAKDSSFIMGQEVINGGAASPVHQVTFTYNFYMDTTEVTQGEYDSLMKDTIIGYSGYSTPSWNNSYGVGPLYPVYYVNWYDAVLFCNLKSKIFGKDTIYSYSSISGIPGNDCILNDVVISMNKDGFRLPTEAEWEYSCRAGTNTEYFWGVGNASEYAWYSNNSGNSTHEVAGKIPNEFNLYDMPGNVWEWCTDGQDQYTSDPKIDPVGSLTATAPCGRGASLSDQVEDLRSATRFSSSKSSTFPNFGFRTVIQAK